MRRLFDLAGDGKAAELRALLKDESIESMCVMDSGGRTPLNLAILSGNLDAVKVGALSLVSLSLWSLWQSGHFGNLALVCH